MSGHGRGPTWLAATVLLAAVAAALAGLGDTDLAMRLAGGALAAIISVRALERMPGPARPAGRDAPDAFEAILRRDADAVGAPHPPEREHLGTVVRLSLGAAGDAHNRLRPLLRELADTRLDAAYGTHVDADPRAAERLGPEAWELVRPDRPAPADPLAPGPSEADLEAAVTALERLGGADASDGNDAHATQRRAADV